MIAAYSIARDAVRVFGPEAVAYLQGQLSQDVESLAAGTTVRSFVLQPTGKVDCWARVTRTGGDEFVLDVDDGYGEALAARLQRFLLRTKAEIEPVSWPCVAVRGRGAEEMAGTTAEDDLWLPAHWPGMPGVDILGPGAAPPAGVPEGDIADYEGARIVAGVPAMGAELSDTTIPAEAGQWVIDASVSFSKGCFTGQELVARIDSRGGNVPRHLRGLVLAGAVTPPVGAAVEVDGAKVGSLTSTGRSQALGAPVALAFIGRAVELPAEATVSWPDGEEQATVRALPLSEVG